MDNNAKKSKRTPIDPRSLDTGIPQQFLNDEYLQQALQKAGIEGMPAWMMNQYALNPNADIGQDLYTALLDYDVPGNLDDKETIGLIPDALEYLSDKGVPGLPPIDNENLKSVISWLPEDSQTILASEMGNGLTEDELVKHIIDSTGQAYDAAPLSAIGLGNTFGLSDNEAYIRRGSLPVDKLESFLRSEPQIGLGEANEIFKKNSGGKVDLLGQIIGNKPLDQSLPIGSPLLGHPDTSPVYGWNVNRDDSPSLPTATAPTSAAGGGGTTVPPNNNKGLKGFFENAKGNASNTWNNKVKPAASGMWNGKIKPGVSNVWQYMKAHPGMSAGLGITGAANLAGLFDNTKVGGQLLGAGLGAGLGYGILPKLAGTISPQAQLLTTLTGGSLGALFDNLRSKQEKEREQQRYMYR